MKGRQISLIIGIGFTFLAIFGTSNSLAVPTQWFPVNNTTIDYTLTNYMNWQNGTTSFNSRFNAYNQSSLYFLCPTKLDQVSSVMPAGWTLLKANAVIKMRHVYADATSTTLNRDTFFFVDNISLGHNAPVGLVNAHSNVSYTYRGIMSTTNYSYQKDNFVDPPTNDITDYFNNAISPGQQVMPGYGVIAATSDHIIAFENVTSDTNYTYIADSSGKVTSFTVVSSFALGSTPNLHGISFMFETSSTTSSSIPGFPIEWLLVIASGSIVFIVSMARRYKKELIATG